MFPISLARYPAERDVAGGKISHPRAPHSTRGRVNAGAQSSRAYTSLHQDNAPTHQRRVRTRWLSSNFGHGQLRGAQRGTADDRSDRRRREDGVFTGLDRSGANKYFVVHVMFCPMFPPRLDTYQNDHTTIPGNIIGEGGLNMPACLGDELDRRPSLLPG